MKKLIAFFCCAIAPWVALADMANHRLDIYFVDTEGGAATLIITPANESILIDAGSAGGRDSKRVFEVANKYAKIGRIDYLITTHFHTDHYGGAAELARLIVIGTVCDNGIPSRDPDNNGDTRFPLLIAPYRAMYCFGRVVVHPDDTLQLNQLQLRGVAKVSLRCLAAKQKFTQRASALAVDNSLCATATSKPTDTSDNANSIVLLLEFGQFRFYAGGDLTWNLEGNLACPVNLVGKVDVYQVDHHGLDLSNNPMLVHTLDPIVSIMSNGTNKGCGPETFATLKSCQSIQAMYQIHRNLRADSENNTAAEYIANEGGASDGHFIKLSVAPDGTTYTVSIPATGQQRTFKTRNSH